MFCVFALQLEKIKKLYTDTYRASEKAAEKIQSKNSQNDGGNNSAVGYNVDTQFSVNKQWHTGFPATIVKELVQRVERDYKTSTKIITETANWYTTRIGGVEYFVICSTEDSSPTVLYASRDKRAAIERDALVELIEVIENGESIDGKSETFSRILSGSWLRQGNGIQNSVGFVGGGSSNRNAGVLQSKSSGKTGRAFRNVIENLFEISGRRTGRGVTQDRNTQNFIKETTGRRFLEAINSNEDDVARKLLNEQAKQNG